MSASARGLVSAAVAFTFAAMPHRAQAQSVDERGWSHAVRSVGRADLDDPDDRCPTAAALVSTGNMYSGPQHPTSDAVLALDLDDGHIVWTRQMTARDISPCQKGDSNCLEGENGPDFDFGNSPILTPASAQRQLIVIGQKSGIQTVNGVPAGGASINGPARRSSTACSTRIPDTGSTAAAPVTFSSHSAPSKDRHSLDGPVNYCGSNSESENSPQRTQRTRRKTSSNVVSLVSFVVQQPLRTIGNG
jgi:hypothetical protein